LGLGGDNFLIFLVLLFQLFEKIALGRVLWNIVDVIVAVYMLISLRNEKQIIE
jgi:hypothetical protein